MAGSNVQDKWLYNVVASLVMFVALCIMIPPYCMFKIIKSIVKLFYKDEDMAGKVVLITGASSGIGECMAYEYARRRAYLVIVARRESRLREVAVRARSLGSPNVVIVCADVSNIDDCKKFVEEAIQHFGRLDHLVNNAGIAGDCSIEDGNHLTNFKPIMDINFWGSVYPSYFAIPYLKSTKGAIIVNASAAGLLHPPEAGLYGASKAALISFYESLRVEVANSISVTIVTLGYIESEISKGKLLHKDGAVRVDKRLSDFMIQSMSMMSTEPCAKAIVKGACRRERYVTEPQHLKVIFIMRSLCPEFVELFFQKIHLPSLRSLTSNSTATSTPPSLQAKLS